MQHQAAVISYKGKSLSYAPTLRRGDEPTRLFATASKDFVEAGGISVVFSADVTQEAIDRLKLLVEAHEKQLRARAFTAS